jgi:hypothetical protein
MFAQDGPFATATVYFSPPRGASSAGDATPPAILPPEAYAEMTVGRPAPPVMNQFSYRPVAGSDARGAANGWDLVWVRPLWSTPVGRTGVARLLDCWYPPNHMRVVREYLAGAPQLTEPPAVNLLAASVLFPAADQAYTVDKSTLVANRIDTITDGHYYEHAQAWSEAGELLLAATVVRRNEHGDSQRTART